MDEELKKLLEDLAGGPSKRSPKQVQTLATAQTTIVDRLEKAEGDNKTLSDHAQHRQRDDQGLGRRRQSG